MYVCSRRPEGSKSQAFVQVIYILQNFINIFEASEDLQKLEEIILKKTMLFHQFPSIPPVNLYLIFEKSSCKNQVQLTGFSAYKSIFRN